MIFQQLIAANKELIAKCEDKKYDSDSDYEKEKIVITNNNTSNNNTEK